MIENDSDTMGTGNSPKRTQTLNIKQKVEAKRLNEKDSSSPKTSARRHSTEPKFMTHFDPLSGSEKQSSHQSNIKAIARFRPLNAMETVFHFIFN